MSAMPLPSDMDPECVELCNALNALPGIATFNSCCGHGKSPYRIFFFADNLEALPHTLYYFDSCHSGARGWRVIARTDCGMSPVTFMAEGPVGAYDDAQKIAAAITESLAEESPPERTFGIDLAAREMEEERRADSEQARLRGGE